MSQCYVINKILISFIWKMK